MSQRSTWQVDVVDTNEVVSATCSLYAIYDDHNPHADACGKPAISVARDFDGILRTFCVGCAWWAKNKTTLPLPKIKEIRVVESTEGLAEIHYAGKTAEELIPLLESSGLVSTIGDALWLGAEIAKAERLAARETE
jgi:hypothetical protein